MPLKRFLKYITFDTQSVEGSNEIPSSKKQLILLKDLKEEMEQIGLSEVSFKEDKGYIVATLPANTDNSNVPTIGFIAHIDTSPDASGENIKAKIVCFDGTPICLNEEKKIFLDPDNFPDLKKYLGQEIIVTDGTTLLGADDKAGVAEIMSAMEYLKNSDEIKHGKIKIAFTCDEEVGAGVDYFDVKDFGADWAYTMDGGEIGELEYENFNAASAVINFYGRNIHPGYAKDKMVNSMFLARKFANMLPGEEVPEKTEGREGFFHLTSIEGCVEHSTLRYIIRDHDKNRFIQRKNLFKDIEKVISEQYGLDSIHVEVKDQYYNMLEKIEPSMYVVDIAKKAIEDCGITPIVRPIRGGTDGARLSFEGLPCPNIFAGGHNFHGRFEFLPVNSLYKAKDVIVKICELTNNWNF